MWNFSNNAHAKFRLIWNNLHVSVNRVGGETPISEQASLLNEIIYNLRNVYQTKDIRSWSKSLKSVQVWVIEKSFNCALAHNSCTSTAENFDHIAMCGQTLCQYYSRQEFCQRSLARRRKVRGWGSGLRGTSYRVRGTGSRGVENTGWRGLVEGTRSCGKHGIYVKNTGSNWVENTGSKFFLA